MIKYEDYSKVEIRIGEIKKAERIEKSEKLFLLSVDFGLKPSAEQEGSPDNSAEQNGLGGERDLRTVVSGIAPYFETPEELIDVQCAFVTNLEPRPIMGYESQAMILGAKTETSFALLKASTSVEPGSVVG